MDYAVEIGALGLNPIPRRRRSKVQRKHFPAVTNLAEIGEILRAARAADPAKGIQRGHVLLVYTGQRVSEVTGATWDEFKLDGHVFALGFRYARLGSRRKRVDRQLPVMLLTVECGVDPAGRRNCDIRTQPENAVVISRTGQALHFSPIRFSALKA
jgi:integrase